MAQYEKIIITLEPENENENTVTHSRKYFDNAMTQNALPVMPLPAPGIVIPVRSGIRPRTLALVTGSALLCGVLGGWALGYYKRGSSSANQPSAVAEKTIEPNSSPAVLTDNQAPPALTEGGVAPASSTYAPATESAPPEKRSSQAQIPSTVAGNSPVYEKSSLQSATPAPVAGNSPLPGKGDSQAQIVKKPILKPAKTAPKAETQPTVTPEPERDNPPSPSGQSRPRRVSDGNERLAREPTREENNSRNKENDN